MVDVQNLQGFCLCFEAIHMFVSLSSTRRADEFVLT